MGLFSMISGDTEIGLKTLLMSILKFFLEIKNHLAVVSLSICEVEVVTSI